MSYRTWTDYGYGVECPMPKSKERVIEFAKNHAKISDLCNWLEEDEENWEETVLEYEGRNCGCCGAASILDDVICGEKGVELYVCQDFDGRCYLLFTPYYPWANLNKFEKAIQTEEDVQNLIRPYLEELYGEDIPQFNYQEVQNGG